MKTETQDDTLSVSTFTPLNSTLPLSSTPPSPLKKSQKCKRTTTNLKAEKPTSATNSFTPSQDTEIIKLRNENVKYKAILKIFQDRDGFTGNEKSVKNRYFKVKDEITELGDDDVCTVLSIKLFFEKLHSISWMLNYIYKRVFEIWVFVMHRW